MFEERSTKVTEEILGIPCPLSVLWEANEAKNPVICTWTPSQPERIRSTIMDQQQFWECKSHLQEGCKLEDADNTWSGWKVIRLLTNSVSALTRMFFYMAMVIMSYPMQPNTTLYLIKFGQLRQKKKKKRSSLTSWKTIGRREQLEWWLQQMGPTQ